MLKFYHSPWSRSSGVFWLLEELGQPYEMELIDIRAPGGVAETYRAIQPNKKVPAIDHDGTIVTERAAICLHLTEAFPQAGLAPQPGDKSRSAFLTWLVYCDSVFDPAVAARVQGWEYRSNNFSFGSFDDMVQNVEKTLTERPYAAGDKFTAADTQLASGVHYALNVVKVLPERPTFRDYLGRVTGRPAFQRFMAKDAELINQVTPPQFDAGN
jgi:glutathione S-transferase